MPPRRQSPQATRQNFPLEKRVQKKKKRAVKKFGANSSARKKISLFPAETFPDAHYG